MAFVCKHGALPETYALNAEDRKCDAARHLRSVVKQTLSEPRLGKGRAFVLVALVLKGVHGGVKTLQLLAAHSACEPHAP